MARLYLSPPLVTDADRKALLEAFDSNWIAPVGPHLSAFEEAVSERLGVSHAVALSSGTAGLHLALLTLGVGPGDDVLVSDLTFAAPANAVTYVGAHPILVDSDEATWNISVPLVREELSRRSRVGRLPKAVIAVDLYGQVADFDELRSACAEHDLPLVEDAAEALGASYKGRPAGSLGDVAVLSFNGNKVITTSGGGMLLSDRQDITSHARSLATQAREPVVHYEHLEIGYNYRLSNLLAALGLSQFHRIDSIVSRRREINAGYRQHLGSAAGITFMPHDPLGEPSWWLTCVLIDPEQFGASRDDVMQMLEQHDIESRPTWKPMHLQPAFAGAEHVGGSVSANIFARGLCLPSGSNMSDSDVERVATLVRSMGTWGG